MAATIYDDFITNASKTGGLDKARLLTNDPLNQAKTYTAYTPSAATGPVKVNLSTDAAGNLDNKSMYNFSANAPLNRINAPDYRVSAGVDQSRVQQTGVDSTGKAYSTTQDMLNAQQSPQYQGLMGGDYNSLQTALEQPGQIKAQNAYNAGTQNLTNTMGGRGLYGSSVMQQQQTQGLDREFMNASAANAAQAAAQRYQMEQAGLQSQNQFGLDLFGQQLAQQKDINAYGAQETAGQRGQESEFSRIGAANADAKNQFNQLNYNDQKAFAEAQNNWQNQKNYEQNFLYPQAKNAFDQAQTEQLINRQLALAGQGAPLAAAQQNALLKEQEIAAQQAAAKQASSNQLWGALATGAGTLGSAYMNNYTGNGLLGLSQ